MDPEPAQDLDPLVAIAIVVSPNEVQEYGEGEPSLKRRRDIAEDEEQPKPKKAKTEKPKPFACTYKGCNKSFTSKSNQQQHMRLHEGVRPFRCTVQGCTRSYVQRSHLISHLRSHSIEREDSTTFKCTFVDCPTFFTSVDELLQHEAKCHSNKLFTCDFPECGKSFTQKGNLVRHAEKHRLEAKTKTSRSTRVSHDSAIMDTELKWKCMCSGCNKLFETDIELIEHMKTRHNIKSVFPCPVEGCRKMFIRQGNLRHHIAAHNSEKSLRCTVKGCSRTFNRQCHLSRHVAKHMKAGVQEGPIDDGSDDGEDSNSYSEEDENIGGVEEKEPSEAEEVPEAPEIKVRSQARPNTRSSKLVPQPKREFRCPFDGCKRVASRESLLYLHTMTDHEGEESPNCKWKRPNLETNWMCPVEGCQEVFYSLPDAAAHYQDHFKAVASIAEPDDQQDKSLVCLESLEDDPTSKAQAPSPPTSITVKLLEKIEPEQPGVELFNEADFLQQQLETALLTGLLHLARDNLADKKQTRTQSKLAKQQNQKEKKIQKRPQGSQAGKTAQAPQVPPVSQAHTQQPSPPIAMAPNPLQQLQAGHLQNPILQQQLQHLQMKQELLMLMMMNQNPLLSKGQMPPTLKLPPNSLSPSLQLQQSLQLQPSIPLTPPPLNPLPPQSLLPLSQQSLQLQQLHLQQLQQLQHLSPPGPTQPRLSQLLLQQHLLQLNQLHQQPK